MKPHIAILYTLISLCLIFSLTALLIVANDHGAFTQTNPSATPTVTPTTTPETNTPTPTTHPPTTQPTPNPTPATTPPNQLTITYTETNRQNVDNNKVKVTLTVTAAYPSENTLTIKYSDFHLDLAVFRMIYEYARWEAYPQNSGTFTIGSGHTTESFQLTFEFVKTLFNGMDNANVAYKLQYNDTTPVNWGERHWQ